MAQRTKTKKIITLDVTHAEANALLGALAVANGNELTPKDERAANTWVAQRLLKLLRAQQDGEGLGN